MKKIIVLILVLALSLGLSGCGNETSTVDNEVKDLNEVKASQDIVIIDPETPAEQEITEPTEVVETPVEDTQPKELVVPDGSIINPLTGEVKVKSEFLGRPIAVMLDNYYKARPQAGLSQADVVYEMLVEGKITRYMAVFYSEQPKLIGPTRSARPYYLDKALEYDPLYVHVGGSEEAKKLIKEYKMADIDGLYSGAFWRKGHKPKPNNMYTSTSALVKDAKNKKYRDNVEVNYYTFNEFDKVIEGGKEISAIRFPYRGTKYYSGFEYNEEEKLFYRYVNSKPHIDENNDEHLSAKNIIVQFANKKVIDSVGRLDIDLIGEGKGKYLTNGKIIDITWKKDSQKELTRYYDNDGNEIILNPGITWFQVVPTGMELTIRD